MSGAVTARTEGHVLVVSFTAPERLNALTVESLRVLCSELDRFAADPELRVLVFTGTGRAFCVGGDMHMLKRAARDPGMIKELSRLGHQVSRGLELIDKPTICAVNGVAAGAGVDLALACDLRVASSAASFVLTFTSIGLIPDMGATWRLPRLVGVAKAKELVMLGPRVTAEEAERLGLVNKVVNAQLLEKAAMDWAQELAERRAPLALGIAKSLLGQALATDLTTGLRKEQIAAAYLTGTRDFAEGVDAFLEKRPSVFQGE